MNLKTVSKVLTKIGKYAKLKSQIITLTLDVLGDFFPKIFNMNFNNFLFNNQCLPKMARNTDSVMTKKIMLLLIVAMCAAICPADAQVSFKNASKTNIKVSSIDNLQSVEVFEGKTITTSFLHVVDGAVSARISHSVYRPGNGFGYVEDGIMNFEVKNNLATFQSPKQKEFSVKKSGAKLFA